MSNRYALNIIPPLNIKNDDDDDDDDDVSSICYNEVSGSDTEMSMGTPDPFEDMKRLKHKEGKIKQPKQSNVASDELMELIEGWIQIQINPLETKKIQDKEELEEKNKIQKVREKILADQLWRPVMSDPNTNRTSFPLEPDLMSKGKGHRFLHDTKVKTETCLNESILSTMVLFEARILTHQGKAALRELWGAFFPCDNTITVYEVKHLANNLKVMPLIKRDTYELPEGPRKGEKYALTDIMQEKHLKLTFKMANANGTTRGNEIIITICWIDEAMKKNVLLKNVKDKWMETKEWNHLHLPTNEEEKQIISLLHLIQEKIKGQIAKMDCKTILRMGDMLRENCRKENNVKLDITSLQKSVHKMNFELSQNKLNDLLAYLDPEGTHFINYHDFMLALIGEMSENRKKLVRKAFGKIDPKKPGSVEVKEMQKFIKASYHPNVISGKMIDHQLVNEITKALSQELKISYRQFEELFEGISLKIKIDEDFDILMRNMFNV